MTPEEFAALARVERDHWFYRGKRDLVRHWVARLAPLRREDLLVDVGAGTGLLLDEVGRACRRVGIEPNPHALRLAGRRPVPLVRATLERLPLRSGCAAVVTALDVLEHLEDDAAALAELQRITRPGGLIILLVPASPRLWSDWDVALGHRRRYTRSALLELVRRFPLTIQRCVYVNAAAFPAILAVRLLRARFGIGGRRRLEDDVPPAPLNRLLHWSFVAPARWPWFSPPFGVSLLCLLRRRGPGPTAL